MMDGKQIADKVRMMGYDRIPMATAHDLTCAHCQGDFKMVTMVTQCPHCAMVYAVTPCHAHDAGSVQAAGIDF